MLRERKMFLSAKEMISTIKLRRLHVFSQQKLIRNPLGSHVEDFARRATVSQIFREDLSIRKVDLWLNEKEIDKSQREIYSIDFIH